MAEIPTWPATLPLPSPDSYNVTPGTPYIRTAMDGGRARQRRRFTRVSPSVDVVWTFTQLQYAIFEAWLQYEVHYGASFFEIDLVNGLGIGPARARFMNDPPFKATLQGSTTEYWQVTATLDVKPLPIMSRDDFDVLSEYSAPDLDALANALHTLVHVTLPGPGRWD
ncbi:hypothetical protein GIY62_06110 [Burkholderia plantarii]|uniref:hypothetical protein n=1 Tax=Burkholderia plantarii TaxID=41899 RepID=UPI00272D6652|nr:hypothetical protein [Burkholderia plantarii]WLE60231.1 hypothetical protein GIY62_06110 [Burkholderia plantarii]